MKEKEDWQKQLWEILAKSNSRTEVEHDLVDFIDSLLNRQAKEIIDEIETNPTPGEEFKNLQLWIEQKQQSLSDKFISKDGV